MTVVASSLQNGFARRGPRSRLRVGSPLSTGTSGATSSSRASSARGAQDLVLDLSFRHYRGGAAPRNWHRNVMKSSFTQATRTRTSMRRRLARLPSTGSFIGIIGVIWTSCRSSPAPPGGLDPLRVAALAVSTRAPGDDRLLGDLG